MFRYTSLVLLTLVSFSMGLYRLRFFCDENGDDFIRTTYPQEYTAEECEEEGWTDTCDGYEDATYWLFNCVEE